MKIQSQSPCAQSAKVEAKKSASEALVVRSAIRAGLTPRPVSLGNKVWTDDWLTPI